jgi:benzaldehyde dehydrogenase (NAD)
MTWLDEAAWQSGIYLNGWNRGSGGDYAVIEPATGKELGRLGVATPDDVERAAERAVEAQRAWAATPYDKRAAVLRKAGALWHEHGPEIHDWIMRETGAIPPKAHAEVEVAAGECYEAAALAAQPYGEMLRSAQPRLSLARRVPVGIVGVIAPFNFPLILSIRSVAPALATGNAVILKPDQRTAVSGGVIVARIFEEAGLPEGLLSVLPGGPEVGEALVQSPPVRLISFTGSTRAGRKVGALAGQHLKRVILELGGNSAMIVTADVDLDRAVSAGAFGSFLHQGQICMATGRHLVDAAIAADYTAALAEHADRLTVGDPATEQVALGPIIDDRQLQHVHEVVTASVAAGARLAAGGTHDGLFYRPTVLADTPVTSPAFTEEIFGPVAPVLAYDSLEDAISLATATEYGLKLGILTGDPIRAMEIAERIPVGAVHINDQTVSDEPVAPFGGHSSSGVGSPLGGPTANLAAFTEVQWVTAATEIPAYPF